LYESTEMLSTDEDGKAWLATIVKRVVVNPAPRKNDKKFDPSRIKVEWKN